MTKLNKEDLLIAMSAHVRSHGLSGASLRPLARASGTSDRMLIYHFGNKEGLITALLSHLADEIASALRAALPAEPAKSDAEAFTEVLSLLRTPTFRPYLRIWFDMLSGATGEDTAFWDASQRVAEDMLNWIVSRLPDTGRSERARAQVMLTLIQGVLVLDAAGMGDTATSALKQLSFNA